MGQIYKLGNFTFNSKEEYEKALKELKLISAIKNKYDVNNRNIAKQILAKISEGEIRLETVVGKSFIRFLNEKIDGSESLSSDKVETKVPPNNVKRKKKKKKKKNLRVPLIISVIAAIICVISVIKMENGVGNIINVDKFIHKGDIVEMEYKEYADGYYITGVLDYSVVDPRHLR